MEVEAEEERGKGEGGEDAVVQGEDAEYAAGVELAEVAGIGERVVENTGDQETGEGEEEIDAAGAKGEGIPDEDFEGGVRGGGEEMGAGDAEDREATDTVEGRKVTRIRASLSRFLFGANGPHLRR